MLLLALPGDVNTVTIDDEGSMALSVLRALGLPGVLGLVQSTAASDAKNHMKERSAAKKHATNALLEQVGPLGAATVGRQPAVGAAPAAPVFIGCIASTCQAACSTAAGDARPGCALCDLCVCALLPHAERLLRVPCCFTPPRSCQETTSCSMPTPSRT